ncbi:hypothetical protein [Streptomyces sp. NPDC002067]
MHRPSVPGDLAGAEELWARAVTRAVVGAALDDGEEYGVRSVPDGRELRYWNAGGSCWWRLTRSAGGRAVLCGQDADGSYTHLGDAPVDLLAGGPEWLPWERLRDDAEGRLLGFVYWWDGVRWARAPYPERLSDDGLGMAMGWAAPGPAGLRELAGGLVERAESDAEEEPVAEVRAFADAVTAGAVGPAAIAALLEAVCGPEPWQELDHGAALASAEALGATGELRGGALAG